MSRATRGGQGPNHDRLSSWPIQWPPKVSLGTAFPHLAYPPPEARGQQPPLLPAPGPLLGAGTGMPCSQGRPSPTFICQASLRNVKAGRGSAGTWRHLGGVGAPVSKRWRERGSGARKRAGPGGPGLCRSRGALARDLQKLCPHGWVLRSQPSPRAAGCVLGA